MLLNTLATVALVLFIAWGMYYFAYLAMRKG